MKNCLVRLFYSKSNSVYKLTDGHAYTYTRSIVIEKNNKDTGNSSGDEIANGNFFTKTDDIVNHFYAVRPGNYRIR